MSSELDDLLSQWATARRVTIGDAARIRQRVLADQPAELDADWLWSLLRPVTALLDGPRPLAQTVLLGFTG
jgi:hypothetical protein